MTYVPPSPTTFDTFTDDEGRELAAVFLRDQGGKHYEAHVEVEDWRSAVAVSPFWRVEVAYEVPQVISTDNAAILHSARTWRPLCLFMKNFIMAPPYRETVRFLDSNTLNFVRSNLVVRPKGARTIPTKREIQEAQDAAEYWAEVDREKAATLAAATKPPRHPCGQPGGHGSLQRDCDDRRRVTLMPYDIQGALAAGLTPDQITSHLAANPNQARFIGPDGTEHGYNVGAALNAGYSPEGVIGFLSPSSRPSLDPLASANTRAVPSNQDETGAPSPSASAAPASATETVAAPSPSASPSNTPNRVHFQVAQALGAGYSAKEITDYMSTMPGPLGEQTRTALRWNYSPDEIVDHLNASRTQANYQGVPILAPIQRGATQAEAGIANLAGDVGLPSVALSNQRSSQSSRCGRQDLYVERRGRPQVRQLRQRHCGPPIGGLRGRTSCRRGGARRPRCGACRCSRGRRGDRRAHARRCHRASPCGQQRGRFANHVGLGTWDRWRGRDWSTRHGGLAGRHWERRRHRPQVCLAEHCGTRHGGLSPAPSGGPSGFCRHVGGRSGSLAGRQRSGGTGGPDDEGRDGRPRHAQCGRKPHAVRTQHRTGRCVCRDVS